MESNYKFVITKIAADDIFEAEEYIKNVLLNNDSAVSLSEEIKEKIRKVCKLPMLNNDCKYYGIDDENYRYIKVNNYNFFYRVDKINKKISFFRFLYSGKNINADTLI